MPAIGATPFWINDPAPVEALRFRRMPLLGAACAFALGDFFAHSDQLAGILVAALALLLLLTFAAIRFAPRVVLIPLPAMWAVAGCWCAQMQPAPPRHTDLRSYADGLSRVVRGRVMQVRLLPGTHASAAEAKPQPWLLEPGAAEAEGAAPTQSIDIALSEVEDVTPDVSSMQRVEGGLRVTLLDGTLPLACGDRLEMPLRFREPELYRDAGASSYADQLAREGITVLGSVKAAKVVRMPAVTRASAWPSRDEVHCRIHAAQAWASGRLSAYVSSRANQALPSVVRLTAEDAGMLAAMLFGDRAGLRHDLRAGFERTGSFQPFRRIRNAHRAARRVGVRVDEEAARAARCGHVRHARRHSSVCRAHGLRRAGAARAADGRRVLHGTLDVARHQHSASHWRRGTGGVGCRPTRAARGQFPK